MNLFDVERFLSIGLWRLPLYQAPVNAALDTRDIETLKPIAKTTICLRIGHVQSEFDQEIKFHDPKGASKPSDYEVPDIHNIDFVSQDGDQESLEDSDQASGEEEERAEEEMLADEAQVYEGRGIILKIHSVNNYTPVTSTKVVATLF